AASRVFVKGPGHTRRHIRERSGVWSILPGFSIDDHLFEPMGYSLNAIRDSRYYTVHVTPQPIGSYVSFETNSLEGGAEGIVSRVLEIFRPDSCDVILFTPAAAGRRIKCAYSLKRATRRRLSCGYHVDFRHHYRAEARPRAAYEIVS
ncbi:MAG: S-adenosylmethionine decarboxylase, partial [Elusimicrobia bacterium]